MIKTIPLYATVNILTTEYPNIPLGVGTVIDGYTSSKGSFVLIQHEEPFNNQLNQETIQTWIQIGDPMINLEVKVY